MGTRPVTLCTAQWADVPFDELCALAKKMGYDGLEVACWGEGIDIDKALTDDKVGIKRSEFQITVVPDKENRTLTVSDNGIDIDKALSDDSYVAWIKENLEKNGLVMKAMACHIIGQCVGDLPDPRLDNFAPPALAGQPEAIQKWAVETMKKAPAAAAKFGVKIITGFTGSPIWRYLYSFPQTPESMVEEGFDKIVSLWTPILDEFKKYGVVFALEVHPGEIAFDYYSTKKLLEKFADRPEFGLNFDPSHLLWQGVTPHLFLQDFIDRVYHVHMKDARVTLDGRSGLLGSHIDFGDLRR